MSNIMSTGNATVDVVGQMNLTGNVTPANWYKTILKKTGKPYLLAICILSEICYWYRPTEVRDEQTGMVIAYRKKFKEDLLQKNYQQLADQFGESKRTIKTAIDTLEDIGVVTRVWRNKTIAGGMVLNNVLYIALNEDKLHEITFGSISNMQNNNVNQKEESMTENCDTLIQNNVRGGTENCDTLMQNDVIVPTKKCGTYTESYSENISEITTKIKDENTIGIIPINPINQVESVNHATYEGMDEINAVRDYVKNIIDYDVLVSDRPVDKKRIDEMVDIMVETIVVDEPTVWIGKRNIPRKLVVSRFEKYNQETIEYVLYCLSDNTTEVKNIKNYLLTTLYNAPMTIDNYYKAEVNHDMYGKRHIKEKLTNLMH